MRFLCQRIRRGRDHGRSAHLALPAAVVALERAPDASQGEWRPRLFPSYHKPDIGRRVAALGLTKARRGDQAASIFKASGPEP